jgi:hypothetical protein
MSLMDQRIKDVLTRVGTEFKTVRTEAASISGKTGDLATLTTTTKTSAVAALNELKALADEALAAAGATIDDAETVSLTKTWSITKISAQITAGLAALVNGAPGALDTLDELAAAIADDANIAAALTTAIGNRLRVDVNTQGLTDTEKLNGCTNLGLGNPDTNFVATFEGALV